VVLHKTSLVIFLSRKRPVKKTRSIKPKIPPRKKSNAAVSTRKLTREQSRRLNTILAEIPPIEKLDPEIYGKLQSAIREVVEKTVPEYSRWLNSSMGERIVADDCPTPLCSSCGNDCPTPLCSSCGNDCPTPLCSSCGNDCPTPTANIDKIDRVVVTAVDKAITAAIRQALKESMK
jgi:hypothetical protein